MKTISTHNNHNLINWLSSVIFAFLILLSGIYPNAPKAQTFNFNDGTTQGWTLDQMYTTSGQVKFTPLVGYSLSNVSNTLTASTGSLLIGSTDQNDIYLESPDLSSNSNWQGIEGYSLDVTRSLYSPCWGDLPNQFYIQLQVKVIDTNDGNKEKLFAEHDGSNFVFHEILTANLLYQFTWNASWLNDPRYIVKRICLRITGPGDVASECWYRGGWSIDNITAVESSGTKTLGNTTVFGSTSTYSDRRAIPVTFTESGQIQSISIYHNGGSGGVQLGVYTDEYMGVPGQPVARIGITAVSSVSSSAGWQTVDLISPVSVSSGQTVWLAWVFESNPGIRYTSGTTPRANATNWSNYIYGIPDMFDIMGTTTFANYDYSIYCTYTPDLSESLTVTSPNGGESWEVGSGQSITWTSSGTSGTVKIEYSTNNGASWSTQTASTPDDGTYAWTVPNVPSANCLIRISDTDGSPVDQSNAAFTISSGSICDDTWGYTNVFSSTSTSASRRALPVTATESGSIESIAIYHNGGTGNMILGVYSDASALPGTRIGVTSSTPVSASEGWQKVNLTGPVSVTPGQTVWLAWVFENNPGIRYTAGTPGRAASTATWSGGMPASFGTSSTADYIYSIYCCYSPGPPPLLCDNTWGNTDIYNFNSGANDRRAIPVTASESGLLESIVLYHNGGTGNMLMGVYDDASGAPGERLGVTSTTAVSGLEGWQKVDLLSSVPVSSGQTIWLAWVFENQPGIRYTTTSTPGTAYVISATYSDGMPTSFGSSSSSNVTYSIHGCYTPVPDPCDNIISIAGIGSGNSKTFNASGFGFWQANTACWWPGTGADQIYTFTAPYTGTYHLEVTAQSGGFIDYSWKLTSDGCSQTGWICIADVASTGTKGAMSWTAGETYYIRADAEGTTSRSQTFYITYPDPCDNIITITGTGSGYSKTFSTTGVGVWQGYTACLWAGSGADQIYSFTAPVNGTYNVIVTSASGSFIDYSWKPASAGCSQTGWTCISDVISTGTYGSMDWIAGTEYYIRLDAEVSTTSSQTFHIYTSTPDPCDYIIAIDAPGPANAVTFSRSGTGVWTTSGCGWTYNGKEQIYAFTAPVTGNYSLVTTSATTGNWYVGYLIKSAYSCSSTGWDCIGATSTAGTVGSMYMYAGSTYYILADAVSTTYRSQTFYIKAPDPCSNIITIAGLGYSKTFNSIGEGLWQGTSACGYTCTGLEQIYQFTAPYTGTYSIDISAASGDYFVDFMFKPASGGCSSTGWTCIDDIYHTANGNYGSMYMYGGTTYYILLNDENTASSSRTFSIAYNLLTTSGTENLVSDIRKSGVIDNMTVTNIEETPGIKTNDLKVYPNPFSEKLNFEFVSANDANAILELYNVAGQLIERLMEQQVDAGVMNKIEYNPNEINSGMYVYKLILDEDISMGKVIYKK